MAPGYAGYHGPPMPPLTPPDGHTTELPDGEPVGSVLPGQAIAARGDGELVDLSFVPPGAVKGEPGQAAGAGGATPSPSTATTDGPTCASGRTCRRQVG